MMSLVPDIFNVQYTKSIASHDFYFWEKCNNSVKSHNLTSVFQFFCLPVNMCGSFWKLWKLTSCLSTDKPLPADCLRVYLRAECPDGGDTLACHLGARRRKRSTIWAAMQEKEAAVPWLRGPVPSLTYKSRKTFQPCCQVTAAWCLSSSLEWPLLQGSRAANHIQLDASVRTLPATRRRACAPLRTNKQASVILSVPPSVQTLCFPLRRLTCRSSISQITSKALESKLSWACTHRQGLFTVSVFVTV